MIPIERQILKLQRMTLPELRDRYRDLKKFQREVNRESK